MLTRSKETTSATQMEEVTTMEIYTMTKRPSVSLIPACAPLAPSFVGIAASAPAAAWAPTGGVRPVVVLAAERAPNSREHQVQVQAELAQALTLTNAINGTTSITSTTGFVGTDVSKKRYADGGSGVPPRGRPV